MCPISGGRGARLASGSIALLEPGVSSRVRIGGRPDGEVCAVQRVRRAVTGSALPMTALIVAVLMGRSGSAFGLDVHVAGSGGAREHL